MENRSLTKKLISILAALVIAAVSLFLIIPALQGRNRESADTSMTFTNVALNTERDLQEELADKTVRADYNKETNYYEYCGEYKVFIPFTWSNADPYFRPDKTSEMFCFERNYVSRSGFFEMAEEIFEEITEEAGLTDVSVRNEYKYMLKGLYVNRFVFAAKKGEDTLYGTADLIRKKDGNGLNGFLYTENTAGENTSIQDYDSILLGIELP